MYNHLLSNNLLTNTQSGFRPQHSTLTAALDVTDYILDNMDQGELTGAIFLDLKKAFDTVNYNVLLSKLEHLGIKGRALDWFSNYLSNRYQSTLLNNVQSDFKQVTVGVPQGSILGPLLFISFINDLPNVVSKAKTVLYADDTAIMFSAKTVSNIEEVLNKELSSVAKWMENNKLSVNASKTKVMLFGSHHKLKDAQLNISLNKVMLEQVQVFKYLGLYFDPHLKWKAHIDKTTSKISQRLGIVKRIRQYIDQGTMNMLYNAIVLPHIDYCCPIWSTAADKHVNKIQILQNHVARVTLRCKVRDKHVSAIYDELKWMTVRQRADYFTLTLIYRCVHGLAPDYLAQNIVNSMKTHSYGTRSMSSNNIYIGRSRTDWGRRTFRKHGAGLWNHLPRHIKHSANIQVFKKNLKDYILNLGT